MRKQLKAVKTFKMLFFYKRYSEDTWSDSRNVTFGLSLVFFNSPITQQKSTDPQISNAVISHIQNNNTLLHKSLKNRWLIILYNYRNSRFNFYNDFQNRFSCWGATASSMGRLGQVFTGKLLPKFFLNTARTWNYMETFAFLNGLNHRLNKHKKLARKDLARGVYMFSVSVFVFQNRAICAKSLDLSSIAYEIFLWTYRNVT